MFAEYFSLTNMCLMSVFKTSRSNHEVTTVNVNIQYRLLTLTNLFASVLWSLSTFLWFHPMASMVIISALPVKTKTEEMQIQIYFQSGTVSKHYFFNQPDLVMYFVVRAALERKLLTCSTSSPTVFSAPSWLLPPHLTCSKT